MADKIFGYYWEIFHSKTREVVNHGFCFSDPPKDGPDPTVKGFEIHSTAVARIEDPIPAAKALECLLEAIEKYPAKNTHQLQARKVCAGIIKLAKEIENGRASQHGSDKSSCR